MPGGATAHRLIDHVDDVALLYEILGPSLAPIRRAHPVGRGLSGAVDEHERIGPALILRRHYLDVSLALHNLLAGLADVFSANIEIAPLPDRRLIDGRHWQLGRFRARRRAHQDERGQRQCAHIV